MPLFTDIESAPATIFFIPICIIDVASTMAEVVPSPALSLVFSEASLTMDAPRFSILSSSSISLAIVTPSFVICGEP